MVCLSTITMKPLRKALALELTVSSARYYNLLKNRPNGIVPRTKPMAKHSSKKNRPRAVVLKGQPPFRMQAAITNWKIFLLQIIIIVAIGLWIFWPVLHGDWLWDDDFDISKNTVIQDPGGLWKIWFKPGSLLDYYPIKASVQWVQWQLWGTDTFGYHLTNVILHIANGLLVWRLLGKLGIRLAWLGGLLFVIHPVTVESVAWMAELKNTLSLFPFLLAMCAFIDYEDRKQAKDYFLALAFFLVAMLCKTTMTLFPIVILLYIWWKRGGIEWHDLKISSPFFIVSFTLGLVTVFVGKWYQQFNHRVSIDVPIGDAFSRFALAGQSIAVYFSKCVLPVHMSPSYPKWSVDSSSPLSFLPWLVLCGVAFWLWTKRMSWGRHALLGLGFFLINLLLFIGFISISYMRFTWVMDHFLYIPIIGLIGLTVAAFGKIKDQLSSATRPIGVGFVTILMALLAWESHAYAQIFINQETLFTYVLKGNPVALLAHQNLGKIFSDTGRLDKAIEEYQTFLMISPNDAEIRISLGNALDRIGRSDEAMEQYKEASRLSPESALPYYNLGNIYMKTDRLPEAVRQYEQALKISPDFAEAHGNLGAALYQLHQVSDAIEHYQEALKIQPNDAETHANLGIALMSMGRTSDAMDQFNQALEINPDMIAVRRIMGKSQQDSQ